MREKFLKRATVFALTAVVGFAMSACGNKGEDATRNGSADTSSEYVYLPEYRTLSMAEGNSEDVYIGDMVLGEDTLYYTRNFYDPVKEKAGASLVFADLSDTTKEEVFEVPPYELEDYTCIPEKIRLDDEKNRYVIYYCMPDAEEVEDYDYANETTCLVKYDKDMKPVYELDLREVFGEESDAYVSNVVISKAGKAYVATDSVIYVIDAAGKPLKPIQTNADWIDQLVGTEDGRVFYTYYSYNSNGMEMIEVDTQTDSVGNTYKNLPDMNCMIRSGSDGKVLVKGNTKLYEYDLENQESTMVLNWTDSYLTSDYIRDFVKLQNGDYLVYYEDWNQNSKELVTLKKTKAADLPQKEELVLATLYPENESLQRAVIEFNRTNVKYKITVKSYIDENAEYTETLFEDTIKQINTDLTGNNPPDIIDLSYLNLENLGVKGVLEDLTPYLESSTVLKREDFIPNVLNAYKIKDKLVAIPRTFGINTLMGKTSVVGDREGWSLEDVKGLMEKYPDAELMQYTTADIALRMCLTYNNVSFIDYEKGTCNFDSPEFIKMLEFASCFGMTEGEYVSLPKELQENRVLLSEIGVYSMDEYMMYQAMFEEPVTNIGYPTLDGSQGIILTSNDILGICSLSTQKEGAWEFLEKYLQYESNDMYYWGLPARVDELEEMFKEAQKVEYEKDENGELKKDAEGNPIEISRGSWGYDDWETELFAATEEQVQDVRKMIESAKPLTMEDGELLTIISEEAESYFKGQKTAGEVAKIIQSRVSVFVSENS